MKLENSNHCEPVIVQQTKWKQFYIRSKNKYDTQGHNIQGDNLKRATIENSLTINFTVKFKEELHLSFNLT